MADASPDSRSPGYVAAFRTHFWNADTAAMAARMQANCRGARFVVLADETAGTLHVPTYEKIAHSTDLSGIGIPAQPAQDTLWFSGDHALYVLLHALGRHDYYLMSEYDVQVNADLDAVMALVAALGLDLVGPCLRRSDAGWFWHGNASAHFADPWAILFKFVIVSRRALERLYAARLGHAAAFRQGGAAPWAHCESFVPSVLKADPGMRCADLLQFVRLPHFSAMEARLMGDGAVAERGTLAHPVLGRARYIARAFRYHRAANYLETDTELSGLLRDFAFDEVLPHLKEALEREGDAEGLERLAARLRGDVWLFPDDLAREVRNIARGKPASQSSLFVPWSRGATVAEDAGNVVAPGLVDDDAHHTSSEDEPWWQVDLGAPHVIDEVEVLNRSRPEVQDRLTAYFLLGSLDGQDWNCLYFRPIGHPVSADARNPERTALPERPVARYVRLQLPGHGLLNLRRVRVFGEPALPEDAPRVLPADTPDQGA